jgi:hypothetical protein
MEQDNQSNAILVLKCQRRDEKAFREIVNSWDPVFTTTYGVFSRMKMTSGISCRRHGWLFSKTYASWKIP